MPPAPLAPRVLASPRRLRARAGVTLAELVLACTVLAIAAAIGLPRAAYLLDGLRVRQAAHEVSGAVTFTRAAAIRRGQRARLVVDRGVGSIRVEAGGDTLWRRDLTRLHRVRLHATRDTVTFAPDGMGFGVANSTIVVSLGQRAESVVVSRLGRARVSY